MPAATPRREPHEIGGQDLPTLGRGAEPRRLDHGYAEAVAPLPGDVAETDAHAHGEPRARRAAIVAVDSLLDRHRRPDRLRGAGEGGHDAVAGILHHGAALGRDRLGQQQLVRPANAFGGFLTERGALRGRVDEVGEQNRRRSGP